MGFGQELFDHRKGERDPFFLLHQRHDADLQEGEDIVSDMTTFEYNVVSEESQSKFC